VIYDRHCLIIYIIEYNELCKIHLEKEEEEEERGVE